MVAAMYRIEGLGTLATSTSSKGSCQKHGSYLGMSVLYYDCDRECWRDK